MHIFGQSIFDSFHQKKIKTTKISRKFSKEIQQEFGYILVNIFFCKINKHASSKYVISGQKIRNDKESTGENEVPNQNF